LSTQWNAWSGTYCSKSSLSDFVLSVPDIINEELPLKRTPTCAIDSPSIVTVADQYVSVDMAASISDQELGSSKSMAICRTLSCAKNAANSADQSQSESPSASVSVSASASASVSASVSASLPPSAVRDDPEPHPPSVKETAASAAKSQMKITIAVLSCRCFLRDLPFTRWS